MLFLILFAAHRGRRCPTCDCAPPFTTSPFADCIAKGITQPPPT